MNKHIESEKICRRAIWAIADLDPVFIPSSHKESELVIDGRKENIVEKPYVVGIVDIEAMVKFKKSKMITPCRSNLSSDINPEPLNAHIMNASNIYREMLAKAKEVIE
jgi:hypothetical protein